MSGRRRLLLATIALPVGLAVLLGIEVVLAINVTRLPDAEPYELDGVVGSGGEPLKVAWLGDSVSAGVGATSGDRSVPRLVAAALGREVDLTVTAISGDRVGDALGEQLPRLNGATPDLVVVQIGGNDVTHLTGGGAFERDLEALLEGVEALGPSHVLVLGIPEFGATPRFQQPLRWIVGWRARRLDAVVERVARRHGAAYVDIAAHTGAAFRSDPDRYHADDDFHPSDDGYRLWADAAIHALRPLLDEPL